MLFLLCIGLSFQKTYGRLSVKNGKIVGNSEAGGPILRGVSLGWDTWWSQYYNADSINHLVTDFHANVIRAAIGIEPSGGYLENKQKALTNLYAAVDASLAQGVYVIIDFHAHQVHTAEAKEFFTTVATKYAGNELIIYEIFNEPESAGWSEIKTYATDVIKTIRAIDPDNLILVPTPQWDQLIDQAASDPLTGFDNIAYVLHFYAGTHGSSFRDRGQKAVDAGLSVFISESGAMNADGDGSLNKNEFENWINWAETNNIPWVVWCLESKAESASILPATGGWAQLTEWGTYIKALITKYQ